ncbi:MAG: CvpA family protein [Candidatus Eremiobacteraeota bacterium]|nr:CvpA family protein [Candidatus Eremiobacteraeota bacterium]
MNGFGWPDVVVVLILVAATFKGFSRGFVAELGGLAALAAGLIAPWFYNGSADAAIASATKLGSGPSHVVGMIGTGIFAYVVVLIAASILRRLARLPLLGTGNALAGAVVGFAKGALLIWMVVFVALFFPLTPAIRASLKSSRFVPNFTMFDGAVETAIEDTLPPFARPFVDPWLDRHAL